MMMWMLWQEEIFNINHHTRLNYHTKCNPSPVQIRWKDEEIKTSELVSQKKKIKSRTGAPGYSIISHNKLVKGEMRAWQQQIQK